MVKNSNIKKMNLIFAFLFVIFVLSACNDKSSLFARNEVKESDYTTSASTIKIEDVDVTILTDKDFVIKNKDTFIKLDEPFDEMEIGEEVISYRNVTENHPYEIYSYNNFVLTVGWDMVKKKDTIWTITLLTPCLETNRGVKIGDSISVVFEKYGKPNYESTLEEYRKIYYYSKEYKILIFETDENEKIAKIKFDGV